MNELLFFVVVPLVLLLALRRKRTTGLDKTNIPDEH